MDGFIIWYWCMILLFGIAILYHLIETDFFQDMKSIYVYLKDRRNNKRK